MKTTVYLPPSNIVDVLKMAESAGVLIPANIMRWWEKEVAIELNAWVQRVRRDRICENCETA